jgi:putative hydrolase of the HAD superfamily
MRVWPEGLRKHSERRSNNVMLTLTYNAVLFDLDDTLHDDTASYRYASVCVARDFARECGVDAEAIRRAYTIEAESFWQNLHVGDLKKGPVGLRQRLWGAALRAVGIHDSAVADRAALAFNHYRKERLELFPGVLELLASLRARGIALGMVTNGFAETHREKIGLLQLEQVFNEIIIADEVGMVKPDPRIFAHVCERLGVQAGMTVMVGDRYDRDIVGAQAAGLQSVWLNMRDEAVPAGAAPPDEIVEDISGLIALFHA